MNLKTGVSRKQSMSNFPKNKYFLPPALQGVRNVRFSENLPCFAFLLPTSWDSPFCFITDDLSFLEQHKDLRGKTYENILSMLQKKSWSGLRNIENIGSTDKGVKNVFRKIWSVLFSWNPRFEIRPFALLLTKYNRSAKLIPRRQLVVQSQKYRRQNNV